MRRTLATALAATVVGTGLVPVAGPAPAAAATTTTATSAAVTSAAATARVRTGGTPLNVRSNASNWHPPVGRRPHGAPVRARCQLAGVRVDGYRTTAMWLKLGKRRWVSDAYVAWRPRRPALPWCDQPKDPAPQAEAAFVRWAAKKSRPSWRRHRVPISVSIAQAINESGWGRSDLTTEGNAYFGIKCFGTPGPIAAGCRPYRTNECENDDCFRTTATFRVYRSALRSFNDHGRFLVVNPRYQKAFRYTGNPNRFAREIHRAGYATDPNYSRKLISLMRKYNLYRFDR
jgi:flagellar protein FlgJ